MTKIKVVYLHDLYNFMFIKFSFEIIWCLKIILVVLILIFYPTLLKPYTNTPSHISL